MMAAKKYIWALLPFSFALNLLITGCTAKGNAETEFWVRANCEMCQETIETALKETPGVVEATFDLEANTAHVRFDSNQVKVAGLHQACANAGYETKMVPASLTAYEALPKCCKKE
jgi:periplasmic mercuric ion binding protein